jgi:predicted RNase H-like HicB family nuclease
MLVSYTAKYTQTETGYMGQLVDWQEVITEGATLEECRTMLRDATSEMILAYRQQNQEIPIASSLLEQIPVEV